jgi:hypothetical protein
MHLTNGFHPLWQLMLAPIFWLTSSPAAAEKATGLLLGFFMIASALICYLVARKRHAVPLAVFGTLIWVIINYRLLVMGVEYGLQCMLIIAIAWNIQQFEIGSNVSSPRPYLFLGGLLGLLFLARLDAILLTVVVAAWLIFKRVNLPAIAAVLSPPAAALIAFSLISKLVYGHIAPVSAAVKSINSGHYLAADPVYLESNWLIAKVFLALRPLYVPQFGSIGVSVFGFGLLTAAHLLYLGRFPTWAGWFERFIRPLLPFIIFGWVSYLAFISLHHDGLSFQPWYYAVHRWLPVMGMLAVFAALSDRGARLGSRILLPANLAAALWILSLPFQVQPAELPEMRRGIFWIDRNLPQETILGSWNAGFLGYHTSQTVVNLDGLVNSWEYFEKYRNDICPYIKRVGITYLVDYFYLDSLRLVSPVWQETPYRGCLDSLEVVWEQPVEGQIYALKIIRVGADGR